jgi:hypothetical protein
VPVTDTEFLRGGGIAGTLPSPLVRLNDMFWRPLSDFLTGLHRRPVGDYVAWIMAGLALFAVVFALA